MIDTYLNIRTMIVSFLFEERTHKAQAPTCLTLYWLFHHCSAIYIFICLSSFDIVIRPLNYKVLSILYPTLLRSITGMIIHVTDTQTNKQPYFFYTLLIFLVVLVVLKILEHSHHTPIVLNIPKRCHT